MSFEVDGYLVVRSAIEMEMIHNVETDISREINVMEGMRSEQSFHEGAAFKLGWPQSCADIVSTFVKKVRNYCFFGCVLTSANLSARLCQIWR
jgi:hypothetical protein